MDERTFAVLDLLAGGIVDVGELEEALVRNHFSTEGLTELLSDMTEKDWIEIASRTHPLPQQGDRILAFDGATIRLTPAGIRQWMDFGK